MRLLVVEDDPLLLRSLAATLRDENYAVDTAADGEDGLFKAEGTDYDCIVLDGMLPKLDGWELLQRLRGTKRTPVLMLTARDTVPDRIRGLDTGADDYITKPFSPKELIARIKAMFRRIRPALSEQSLEYGGIEMDLSMRKVCRDGVPIHLGPTEFNILKFFMENPQRVFSREQLLDMVWGNDIYVEARTIDVHIRRLRKALNDGNKKNIIRTVRSAGYSLDTNI